MIERLPKPLHASVRKALRQAWELDDADKAERLLRNLARRLEQEAPGVAASILEGLDEMLTVNRLGLPAQLRRSLACTNSIENMMGTVRRVCRNVKRWRNAAMALRWTAAGMMEAAKGFRRFVPWMRWANLTYCLLPSKHWMFPRQPVAQCMAEPRLAENCEKNDIRVLLGIIRSSSSLRRILDAEVYFDFRHRYQLLRLKNLWR